MPLAGGTCRGRRGNDPDQARRQHLGAATAARRAVVHIARQRRSRVAAVASTRRRLLATAVVVECGGRGRRIPRATVTISGCDLRRSSSESSSFVTADGADGRCCSRRSHWRSSRSRLGLQRKTLLGIAEGTGGRRGAGNAIANTGVAAAAGAACARSRYARGRRASCVRRRARRRGSDTVASEIGKAWGRRTGARSDACGGCPPGTSGRDIAEGTAAGLLGALALGALGAALGLVPVDAARRDRRRRDDRRRSPRASWARRSKRRGILNNDVLNFVNTAIAAAAAIFLAERSQ